MKYIHALFEIIYESYRTGIKFKSAFKLFFVPLVLLSFANVLPAQNNYYQVQITVNGCQNNPLAGAQVMLDEISADKAVAVLEHYTQLTDSNGVAVFDSVKSSVYNMTVWKPTYDTLTQNNLVIHADFSTVVSLIPIAYPPLVFCVDSFTSIATWREPQIIYEGIPFEDFEDEQFPPPGWQTYGRAPGDDDWFRSNNGGSEGFLIPPGDGFYAVSNSNSAGTNLSATNYLVTPMIDLRGRDSIYLKFQSYFDGGSGESATVMYSTDTGFNWIPLDSMAPNFNWVNESVDLSAFANPDSSTFYIAFYADDHHDWASGWAVDNVYFSTGDANPNGYFVFLDNQMIDYIDHDTNSYTFQNLTYGQTYTGGISAVYDCRTSETVEATWTSSYLYPPQNFTTEYTYNTDEVLATFTPPAIVSSDTDYNPLSFNIYVDNSIFVNSPYQGQPVNDTIKVILDDISLGTHTFKASALYDLTVYGYPGDTAESMVTSSDTQNVRYGFVLPFFEGWKVPDFQINNWSHSNSSGPWLFDTAEGNPTPSVYYEPNFYGYHSQLRSYYLNADSISDGNIYLDFDLKYEQDSNLISYFRIEVKKGVQGGWKEIRSFTPPNHNYTYPRQHINITQYAKHKIFRVGFIGQSYGGGGGVKWFIDNIHIYRICEPPANLTGEYFWHDSVPGQENYGLKICWDAPNSSNRFYSGASSKNSRTMTGFNLYRKGEDEQNYTLYATIPFDTTNSSYCFYDSYPNVNPQNIYCYKVTAVWEDIELCESEPATLQNYPYKDSVCVYVTGIKKQNQDNGVLIYPNPANNRIVVQSQYPVTKVEILTLSGTVALKIAGLHQDKTEVNVSQLPAGLYLVKVYGKDGLTSIGKVAIQ